MKKVIEDIIYVIIWSTGLLYGSFHKIFEGSQTYLFYSESLNYAVENYVFPMIMAMLLFLFDVIYGTLKDRDEGRQTNIVCILLCLSFFLVGFLMPILYNNLYVAKSGFWIAWISLTVMKLTTTCHNISPMSSPVATMPNND